MSKATMTIEGFVAKTPELGNHNGKAVTNVSVAHTPRRKNQQTNQFEDAGPTLWVQASFWEADAQAVVAQVQKGTLVTITGQPELNVYPKQDGTTDAQVRIKFGTLGVIPRAIRNETGNPISVAAHQQSLPEEPWSTPGSSTTSDAWATPAVIPDETPF